MAFMLSREQALKAQVLIAGPAVQLDCLVRVVFTLVILLDNLMHTIIFSILIWIIVEILVFLILFLYVIEFVFINHQIVLLVVALICGESGHAEVSIRGCGAFNSLSWILQNFLKCALPSVAWISTILI